MLRTIDTGVISKAIEEMCIEANHFLSEDMKECLGCAAENEKSPLGRQILSQLQENLQIAGDEMIPYVRELEKEMLEKINGLGIGPGGLGGTVTAFAVNIETYPTHIAGLPVAVNICCHVNRHVHRVI